MTLMLAEELRERLAKRVPTVPEYGDYILNPSFEHQMKLASYKDAAVLIGFRDVGGEANVILTQRTAHLKSHAGQVAFPGGKIDPDDASPEAAAIREAQEEIGLDPAFVTPIGRLPDYLTGSGYRIKPILALVAPEARYVANPDEVETVFEVPFSHLMNLENHKRESRVWQGAERHYFTIHHVDRYIWGVTAGIIHMMHERLYR